MHPVGLFYDAIRNDYIELLTHGILYVSIVISILKGDWQPEELVLE